MLDRSPPSISNVASAIVQSIILVFAFWIRASAIWVILAVALFAGLITIWGLLKRRNEFRRVWCLGILLAVLAVHMLRVTTALHPIYRSEGEISPRSGITIMSPLCMTSRAWAISTPRQQIKAKIGSLFVIFGKRPRTA